jgi:hypothetical protein
MKRTLVFGVSLVAMSVSTVAQVASSTGTQKAVSTAKTTSGHPSVTKATKGKKSAPLKTDTTKAFVPKNVWVPSPSSKLCGQCIYPDLPGASPVAQQINQNGWWLAAGAGYGAVKNTQTGYVYTGGTTPPVPDVYSPAGNTNTYSVSVSGGYQWKSAKALVLEQQNKLAWFSAVRLGVLLESLPSVTLKGQVNDGDQYNYQDKVSSNALFLLGQVDLFSWKNWSPFVEAAVGASLNQTNGYSESPNGVSQPRANPAMGSNTTIAFAYKVGAGLSYAIPNKPWVVSLGYDYANWGHADTGLSTNSNNLIAFGPIPQTLQGNQVILTIRYNFLNKK